MSVDFPAPLGPRRPTISPARASNDRWDTARRRPKCRETSTSRTLSKSNGSITGPLDHLAVRGASPASARERRCARLARREGWSRGEAGATERLGARVVAVERAVNVFEGGDELLATGHVALLFDASRPVVQLQADQFIEQPGAAGDQRFSIGYTI